MPEPNTPERWAIRISCILNVVLGEDHFPIKVAQVARDLSLQLFPDDPIVRIRGDALWSFEGALVRAPPGKKGWGILFNTNIDSPGRINFTLAHEFGHYLLHRMAYPDGFNCSSEDMVRWDTQYGQVEHQANVFASYLLMPLDDFRRQVPPSAVPDLDALGGCADRYDVSLTAAALKWLWVDIDFPDCATGERERDGVAMWESGVAQNGVSWPSQRSGCGSSPG